MNNRYFSELKEILSLMKRIGENVSEDTYHLDMVFENYRLPVIIQEGLIKSYDVDSVIAFISKAFGLKNNIYKGIGQNNCEKIIIQIPKDFDNKNKLDYYLNKYGWFLSREDEENEYIKLNYEKKYDEFMYSFQIKMSTQYLYHVTDEKNVDNILKKGLKPKSKTNSDGYMNNERVYLYLNEPDKTEMLISVSKNPITLRINLDKMNKTTKFYFDPRIENAFYTYEPIPNSAIEILKNTH